MLRVLSSAIFVFKNIIYENFFREYFQNIKQFGSRYGPTF